MAFVGLNLAMRFTRRFLDAATRGRILFAGWLIFLIYAFPGYMTWDSVDQLVQARQGPLQDWHPPVMALEWRLTELFIAGPFPMLVIQSVVFLLGLDALLRTTLSPRTSAIIASLVLVFPPVLAPMAVIWKDSQMAAFVVAGTAALLSPRRSWKIAGCAFLCFATALRYNAPAATLPIVVLLFQWGEHVGWRRYAIAVGTWIAITAVAFGVSSAVTDKKSHAWHGSIALYDIAGTIRYAPPLSDSELKATLGDLKIIPTENVQQLIRKAYDPRWWGPLLFGDERVFAIPQTAAERAAIAAAWKDLVSNYPKPYFSHRLRVFRELLGLTGRPPGAVWDGFTDSSLSNDIITHRAIHSPLQRKFVDAVRAIENTLLFRPWAYLLIAFLLLPACRRQRLAFVLLASGIGYELSLFLVSPSSDYRYSHWMIVCTLVAAVLLFATRWGSAAGCHRESTRGPAE